MRTLTIILNSIAITVICIVGIYQEHRIENLERQLLRIEYDYQVIAAQNEQLHRINDQTLRFIVEGGWYDVVSTGTGD